jgi:hypothetical protein
MNMKKLAALVCVLLMIFGLSACSGSDTNTDKVLTDENPYELYKAANDKLAAADGIDTDMDMTIYLNVDNPEDETVDVQDYTVEINLNGNVKQVKLAENNYNIAAGLKISIPLAGFSSKFNLYYTDGYYYYNIPDIGLNCKMPMDVQNAIEEFNTNNINITEDMIKEASVFEQNGGRYICMKLDGTRTTELCNAYLDSFGMSESLEGADISFGDPETTFTLDADGNMTAYSMSVGMAITADDSTLNLSIESSFDILTTEGVVIDFPSDLDTYEDASELQYDDNPILNF